VAQTVIDNFSQPPQPPGGTFYLVVTGANGTSATTTQSGVDAIGGTRIYYGQKLAGATTDSILLGISGGPQAYEQFSTPGGAGRSKLLYGYSAVNTANLDANNYTTGHTFASLNLNASTGGGVALDYSLGSGDTGTITVTLISGTTGGTQQVSSVQLPIVTTPGSPLLFTNAAFLASNPSLNLGDIDQIVVSVDGVNAGVNFTMDNIRLAAAAVPEPASIALMVGTVTLGAGGFFLRKRTVRRGRFVRRG